MVYSWRCPCVEFQDFHLKKLYNIDHRKESRVESSSAESSVAMAASRKTSTTTSTTTTTQKVEVVKKERKKSVILQCAVSGTKDVDVVW